MSDKIKEAQAVIEEEVKNRVNSARTEIEIILDKYKVSIDAQLIVSARGIIPQILILPNEMATNKTNEGK